MDIFKNEKLSFAFWIVCIVCFTGIIIHGCQVMYRDVEMQRKIEIEKIKKCSQVIPCKEIK